MHKIILLALVFLNFNLATASTWSCAHPEICQMAKMLITENQLTDIKLDNIVIPSGDPHEYEPTINDIKKLMQATVLLVGPIELNPWMKNISNSRSKNKKLKTITLPLPDFSLAEYPTKETEALGHFWLYPKIYCHLKKILSDELELKHPILCNHHSIEEKISTDLSKIPFPIILTHDALLPLFQKLANDKNKIIAIKGSNHHEEASTTSVKKVYDALKSSKVIWILENNIAIASNVKSKIRPTDIIIKLETAKSDSVEHDFEILEIIHKKIQEIGH
jgi:ABC-type Zn uptake system ZnuABC Zn-binding protein ZnuA